MQNKFDDISILVVSCDKYIDVLTPFADTFETYWSDCPIVNRYFLLNELTFERDGWRTINVGKDISWSANLILSLDQIRTDFVLIFFEDMFLSKKVDNELLGLQLESFYNSDKSYIKLISEPKPNGRKINEFFGEIIRGDIYRSTAPAALYDVGLLKELLLPTENAWQFELNGSRRSMRIQSSFYSVYKSAFKFQHGIIRGSYLKSAFNFLQSHYDGDFETDRDVNSVFLEVRIYLRSIRKRLFRLITPVEYRHWVRKSLKKREY